MSSTYNEDAASIALAKAEGNRRAEFANWIWQAEHETRAVLRLAEASETAEEE